MSDQASRPLPDRDEIGLVTALVLLSYGLIRIVELPSWQIELGMLGLLIELEINARFIMLALSGAIAVLGASWMLQSHPIARIRPVRLQNRVLPGLASLGAGTILSLMPVDRAWILGLVAAGIVMVLVQIAEFVAFDPEDPRAELVSAALRNLGVLIIGGIVLAARLAGLRAIFSVPTIFATTTLVCWRSLSLVTRREQIWIYSIACGLVAAQIAWGLHYWPVGAMQAALVIALIGYLGSGLAGEHLQRRLRRRSIYEYGGLAAATLAAVTWLA